MMRIDMLSHSWEDPKQRQSLEEEWNTKWEKEWEDDVSAKFALELDAIDEETQRQEIKESEEEKDNGIWQIVLDEYKKKINRAFRKLTLTNTYLVCADTPETKDKRVSELAELENYRTVLIQELEQSPRSSQAYKHVMGAVRALEELNQIAGNEDGFNQEAFFQKHAEFHYKATHSGLSPRARAAGAVVATQVGTYGIALLFTALAFFCLSTGPLGPGIAAFLLAGAAVYLALNVVTKFKAPREAYKHYAPTIKANSMGQKIHGWFKTNGANDSKAVGAQQLKKSKTK